MMKYCAVAIIGATLIGSASGAEPARYCSQITAIAGMAGAKTMDAVVKANPAAGRGYLAEIVFASRDFFLHRTSKDAARRLLQLMPQEGPRDTTDAIDGEDRSIVLETASDSLCDGESDTDMMALAKLADRLPGQFAEAVILAPEMMAAYIRYDYTTVGNPHNDANIQAQTVCRTHHAIFVKAVDALSTDERDYFRHHAIDPRRCKALWLPESD